MLLSCANLVLNMFPRALKCCVDVPVACVQIECYTNMEQSLQGQDLVLSCEDPGPRGQLHNAAMASVAGHPIWLSALQLAMQRSPAGVAESSSWVMRQALHLWQQTPLDNGMLEVLRTTGPLLLTDVYRVWCTH